MTLDLATITSFVTAARAAKLLHNTEQMKCAFQVLIKRMLCDARINLVIENLPEYGSSVRDGLPERVNGLSIHHTMHQFGDVSNAVVFKNHAYVWFDSNTDAKHACVSIDQMLIDKNIISAYALVI